MEESNAPSSTSILLGLPFMKMAKTKIDVDEGTLFVVFDGEIIKFNIFDAIRTPTDQTHTLCQIDVFYSLEQEVIWDVYEDDVNDDSENAIPWDEISFVTLSYSIINSNSSVNSYEQMIPSVV